MNNLLTVLNERVYRRGAETHVLPLVSAFAASNHLPEDETLQALFDRFLLRCKVDALPREQLTALLSAGWIIERDGVLTADADILTAEDLRMLGQRVKEVQIEGVLEAYTDAIGKIRDLGVAITDRRAVKVLKLIAASAVLCGRGVANASDLWVLRYVWDRVEQIGPLNALVTGMLERGAADSPHPRALRRDQVDPEALARELSDAETQCGSGLKLLELARLRQRVQAVADLAAWVLDAAARNHLLAKSGAILEKLV